MSDTETIREFPEKSLPSGTLRISIAITVDTVNSDLEQQFHVSEKDHLVILVHGIFTRAHWMTKLKPTLENAGFSVAATSFGEYEVSRFLWPFDPPRRKAIERVVRDIRAAIVGHTKKRNGLYPRRLSVISHSFGTYVISRILDDHRDLKWYRVIFCGSVVEEDYRFDKVLDQFSPDLLNEVGTRDYWPAIGESAGWGYGSIGSHGLNNPNVHTRWHKGFRHSDFLTEDFCKQFWIPFLRGHEPIQGDDADGMPRWIGVVGRLRLRWIVLPILLCWRVILFLLPFIILGGAILALSWLFSWPAMIWQK